MFFHVPCRHVCVYMCTYFYTFLPQIEHAKHWWRMCTRYLPTTPEYCVTSSCMFADAAARFVISPTLNILHVRSSWWRVHIGCQHLGMAQTRCTRRGLETCVRPQCCSVPRFSLPRSTAVRLLWHSYIHTFIHSYIHTEWCCNHLLVFGVFCSWSDASLHALCCFW